MEIDSDNESQGSTDSKNLKESLHELKNLQVKDPIQNSKDNEVFSEIPIEKCEISPSLSEPLEKQVSFPIFPGSSISSQPTNPLFPDNSLRKLPPFIPVNPPPYTFVNLPPSQLPMPSLPVFPGPPVIPSIPQEKKADLFTFPPPVSESNPPPKDTSMDKVNPSPLSKEKTYNEKISDLRFQFKKLLRLKGISEIDVYEIGNKCFSKHFAFIILGIPDNYSFLPIESILLTHVASKTKIKENIRMALGKIQSVNYPQLNQENPMWKETGPPLIKAGISEGSSILPTKSFEPINYNINNSMNEVQKMPSIPRPFVYRNYNPPDAEESRLKNPLYMEEKLNKSPNPFDNHFCSESGKAVSRDNVVPGYNPNLHYSDPNKAFVDHLKTEFEVEALKIKSNLMEYGIPEDQANTLASICNSTDEAIQIYLENMEKNDKTVDTPEFYPSYNFSEFKGEKKYGILINQNKLFMRETSFRIKSNKSYSNLTIMKDEYPENFTNFNERLIKIKEFSMKNQQKKAPQIIEPPTTLIPEPLIHEDNYSSEMRELVITYSAQPFPSFSIDDEDSSGLLNNNRLLLRLKNEFEILKTSLPCSRQASIFVQIDAFCMNRQRVLISGPEGTPYANGLYLFELYEPSIYPSVPPKITLLTTGNGSVNFSPSLYSNGFVCMSIINTTSGSHWSSEKSGINQVLVSLQSLIMRNHILNADNEYEAYDGNTTENKIYSMQVKYANMKYAMIDLIQNHPPELRNVIKKHFLLKKDSILNNAKIWTLQAMAFENIFGHFNDMLDEEINNPNPHESFCRLAGRLEIELKKFLDS